MLERMENDYIRNSNAPGTQRNVDSQLNQYLEFCAFANMKAYPTNEFKITKYATFLSKQVKTVQSIRRYCATICQHNELKGHRPVKLGIRFHRAMTGIHKELHHQPKTAEPMTVRLLE